MVSPTGERWAVQERGAARAVGVFDTKLDAVARATEVAKQVADSQVVIRKDDGSIQTKRTYGQIRVRRAA